MAVLTIFVLVGDDIRLLSTTSDTDHIFDVLTIVCLFFFTLEIVLSSLVKEDYFLGFWFLADLFASVSLILDITFVAEAMMGSRAIRFDNVANQAAYSVDETEYARASRSSRVGTRVARLLRVVRLVRLSRILQFFHWFLSLCCKKNTEPEESRIEPGDAIVTLQEQQQSESRVGRKLSERTTQRVICLVLAMLFVIPQMNRNDHIQTMMATSAQYGADVVFQAWHSFETANYSGSSPEIQEETRRYWEMEMLMYIYYHNFHSECPTKVTQQCAGSLLHKLIWVGYVVNPRVVDTGKPLDSLDVLAEGYIKDLDRTVTDWNQLFVPNLDDPLDVRYLVGNIPNSTQEALARPWSHNCPNPDGGLVYGVSFSVAMPCPMNTLRPQEMDVYNPIVFKKSFADQHMEGNFVFIYDLRRNVRWEAIMNMFQTVFVIIMLATGALLFSRDVDKLVLLPIERMISKVEIIRQDPLYAIKLGDITRRDEAYSKSKKGTNRGGLKSPSPASSREQRRKAKGMRHAQEQAVKSSTMETKILENAIIKLGSLLALGFGEAGSEIIGQNLDDDNAAVNAMVPGSKVEAIYGFCEIRNFATTTSVLQEKTMVFVNQVAAIVHRVVDSHLGAANKNVGEAFLLVWRLKLYHSEEEAKIADLAVFSFIQVVAELNRNRQFVEYREHPALLARLPNFRVSLGFGLHLGWSIEGAIGSEFKIDASYLSPHVNIATLLSAATDEYGVTILMSEPLVRSCNPAFTRNFRPIDHLKLSGSNTPIRIFTVDLNAEALAVEGRVADARRKNMPRDTERREREEGKRQILEDTYQVCHVFDTDRAVGRMRQCFALRFLQEFEKGYLNYEAGEWDVAEQVFRRTISIRPWIGLDQDDPVPNATSSTSALLPDETDGPSKTLLEYMAGFGSKAPQDWKGWRELGVR